ncbi:hypothetical protein CJ030_MR2G012900 [Morella rubra]|uniref:Uncharacterized protein n=1 Tax=Morella rubra TaxID=262757 RepID=A0A6A1WF02_9ROSI|nr:hypothetical protein CJ030_MR2G012900 [Morella rubra]
MRIRKRLTLKEFHRNEDSYGLANSYFFSLTIDWISSIFSAASSREPHLSKIEDSIAEIKEEQRKLSKNMEDIATSTKMGVKDIKKLHVVHTKRFRALDKEMRGLKHQVNNIILVASNVIHNTVDEFTTISVDLHAFCEIIS